MNLSWELILDINENRKALSIFCSYYGIWLVYLEQTQKAVSWNVLQLFSSHLDIRWFLPRTGWQSISAHTQFTQTFIPRQFRVSNQSYDQWEEYQNTWRKQTQVEHAKSTQKGPNWVQSENLHVHPLVIKWLYGLLMLSIVQCPVIN